MGSLLAQFFLLVGGFFFSTPMSAQIEAPAFEGQPNNNLIPDLSEDDIEELGKQLEEEIGKLPPDEQEKFYKEAQELADKMQTAIDEIGGEEALKAMSDDEAMKFFEQIFAEEAKLAEPEPEPAEEVKEVKVEEVKKITSEHEKAIEMITSINKRINSFLLKAQGIPEFPQKVTQWAKKKKFTDWDNAITWNTMKTQIEQMVQKLEKVKTKDPKTKEFKYLDDFIADKALYNNLDKLLTTLTQYEPQIEVSTFGLKKLGKASKQAMQKIISSLGEAKQKLKVIEALDKIFEKYEPKAKKLREEEEAVRAKAEAEAKKVRPTAPVVTVAPPTERPYEPTTHRPPGFGYAPAHTPSYAPGMAPKPPAVPKPTPTKPGERPGKPAKPTDKEKVDKEKEERLPYAYPREDRRIGSSFDGVNANLKKAVNIIKEHESLHSFAQHIVDPIATTPVDEQLVDKLIPDIKKSLIGPAESVQQGIKMLKRQTKTATAQQKAQYKRDLENIWKEHRNVLDELHQQIKSVENKWATIQNQIPDQKKERYFGEGLEKAEQKAGEPPKVLPKIYYDLLKAIDEVKKAISEFHTGAAAPVPAPRPRM